MSDVFCVNCDTEVALADRREVDLRDHKIAKINFGKCRCSFQSGQAQESKKITPNRAPVRLITVQRRNVWSIEVIRVNTSGTASSSPASSNAPVSDIFQTRHRTRFSESSTMICPALKQLVLPERRFSLVMPTILKSVIIQVHLISITTLIFCIRSLAIHNYNYRLLKTAIAHACSGIRQHYREVKWIASPAGAGAAA